MEPEVVPAILVKTRSDLIRSISQVRGLSKEIQIDIMDGRFVPNTTVGIEDLKDLPEARYEFHWMVNEPERWIVQVPGPHMHLVHIEAVKSFEAVEQAVKKSGGKLGIAINPETSLELALRLVPKAERVLIMTVHPGFSGQSYIREMCGKIRRLRKLYPKLDIEVDGGINNETAAHAYSCGANILAAASAIFAAKDAKKAIAGLIKSAKSGADAKHGTNTKHKASDARAKHRTSNAGGASGSVSSGVVGARRTDVAGDAKRASAGIGGSHA
ncbi:ribulose-phosphate 3-epimerase [Candidatus Micrarchaeota archaeon]|nr:ribulose-phosphate 3-epimerase [Candidatus Micrarchaeota archaeon]